MIATVIVGPPLVLYPGHAPAALRPGRIVQREPLVEGTASALRGSIRMASRSARARPRSEEHTSELQSLMRISYAVFCLQKKKKILHILTHHSNIYVYACCRLSPSLVFFF